MKNNRAFTLVELMVAVGIIAILAAVSLPAYRGMVAKTKARDGERSLALLKNSQELYRSTHFRYSDDFNTLNIPGFKILSPTSAKYNEYTITLKVVNGAEFSAYASGFPLSPGKEDVWEITNEIETPNHTSVGY